jgi:cobalt-precorrin-5B (C1)-methyltransferase
MSEYVVKGNQRLRTGYTTGASAAAASAAAARMLLTGELVTQATIDYANNTITQNIVEAHIDEAQASCAVIKDAGDDPDVTNGLYIYATCQIQPQGIDIKGGWGVGRVSEAGLPATIGMSAINPVPMAMIKLAVTKVCQEYDYKGGMAVMISVPGGEEVAQRTFNPQLGIKYGISILGTTGIVEPMSEKAIIDTHRLIMDKHRTQTDTLTITLGNYGATYCRAVLALDMQYSLKCSNFIGDCLDYALYKGFAKLTIVGHIGKFVKLAAGIMNTHSATADGRMEILTAHAALAGASQAQANELMDCNTTSAAIEKLDEYGLTDIICDSIMRKVAWHINKRLQGRVKGEVIMFIGERMLGRREW